MKQGAYWLLEGSKHEGYKHLSTGFSLGAALFGPFWAVWRGSLVLLVAFSAGSAFLYVLPQWLISPYSSGLIRSIPGIFGAIYTVVLGVFANGWYRMALESDGWKVVGLTHMKSPTPPSQYGEWGVRESAVISWPVDEHPVAKASGSKAVAGYCVAQHDLDTDRWMLIAADRSWSALEEIPADSLQQAKALAEARNHHGLLRWCTESISKLHNQ